MLRNVHKVAIEKFIDQVFRAHGKRRIARATGHKGLADRCTSLESSRVVPTGHESIIIDEVTGPTPEIEALLHQTEWGTPGGVRYRVDGHDWHRLPRARVMTARLDSELAGCYVLLPRSWGYLRMLLAVDPAHQGKGIGKQLVEEAKNRYLPQLSEGQILAGTIEEDNLRSLETSKKAGYTVAATFETVVFSRLKSRASSRVDHPTDQEHRDAIDTLLAADRDWCDAPETFLQKEHYVLRRGGQVAAGVQACTHQWNITHLGRGTSLIMPMLPLFGVRRQALPFVTLHHMYGDPAAFSELWTEVLGHLGIRIALVCGDLKDPAWQTTRTQLSRGTLGSILGTFPVLVTTSGPVTRPLSFSPVCAA